MLPRCPAVPFLFAESEERLGAGPNVTHLGPREFCVVSLRIDLVGTLGYPSNVRCANGGAEVTMR